MPSYQEICPQLIELLGPFVTDGQTIGEDTALVADLGLSSLKIMDLLMEVEDRFDISIPMNILPDVTTVRDFALQLERLTAAK